MKKLIILMTSIFLINCGGGGGNTPAPDGKVTVKGDIVNTSLVWQNYLPDIFKKAYAAPVISTRSTLKVNNPTRLADVSKSVGIEVSATAVNHSASPVAGLSIKIEVEDETFLTKEEWSCNVTFPLANGGTESEALWTVQGNNLFETAPAPALNTCDASTGSPALCVTQFNNNPDCSKPTYSIDYTPPGNGLWSAEIPNISIAALKSLTNTVSLANMGAPAGTDKYARFRIFNSAGVVIDSKDYVFNLIN